MAIPPGCAFLFEPPPDDVLTKEDLNAEQREMARTAEAFVDGEVLPRLPEIEEKMEGVMPELLRRAGELGLLALEVPEEYEGLGLDKATAMLVSERVAKLASFSVAWGAHTGIGTLPLVYYGTEDQRRHYLSRLATGELLAAYALTEPGSGSDALGAKTTARRDGDHWILDGTKQFITNAGFADLFTVFAQVDGDKFTAFLVERSDPGVSTGPEEQKLGITVECSIVKVFGTECLDEVADESLQILGGYGFLKDYPIERHYRDSRINRIFEGTNEINRLIIPATLFKRASQGAIPYFDYVAEVHGRLEASTSTANAGDEPLAVDLHAVEGAKRVVAWAADLLVKRDLQDLANRQQHLEVLANMIIDLFVAESVVCRTRKLLEAETEDRVANELDLTRIFVASANERIGDGARRLAANELVGEALHRAFEEIGQLAAFLPIATIDAKARIATRIAEGNLRFLS